MLLNGKYCHLSKSIKKLNGLANDFLPLWNVIVANYLIWLKKSNGIQPFTIRQKANISQWRSILMFSRPCESKLIFHHHLKSQIRKGWTHKYMMMSFMLSHHVQIIGLWNLLFARRGNLFLFKVHFPRMTVRFLDTWWSE